MQTKFTVNGKPVSVDAPADMPLLWALRDILKLHGTKYGCGIGECAACTVHINGKAERSCLAPLSTVAGKKITTIEGLSPNGTHPLQVAWQEVDVPQCGYCQSGQIMAAAALLAHSPKPTNQEIDNAMSGNLCRCGTYLRIKKAILEAAGVHQANVIGEPTMAKAAGVATNNGGSK